MIDLLRLCRLYYALPMASILTLTIYYARGGRMGPPGPTQPGGSGSPVAMIRDWGLGPPGSLWGGTLLATAALAAVIATGYVLNDVMDMAVDRVNAPGRPIAAGRVSRRLAVAWAGVLLAIGLALAGLASPRFLAALAAVAGGLAFYNRFSKSLGVGKQLLVAVLLTSVYPLSFALAGWPVGSRAATLAVFPAWLLLTAFGYEDPEKGHPEKGSFLFFRPRGGGLSRAANRTQCGFQAQRGRRPRHPLIRPARRTAIRAPAQTFQLPRPLHPVHSP